MGKIIRAGGALRAVDARRLIQAYEDTPNLRVGSGMFTGRVLWMNRLDSYRHQKARALLPGLRGYANYVIRNAWGLLQGEIGDDGPQIVKWPEGSSMPVHADEHHLDRPGEHHGTPWREFAAVYYLNDNYEGGAIFFPEQDKEVQPKGGDLVVFEGREPHGVRPITKGDRYTLPMWFTRERLRWA
jgi:hypothetical protein